LGLDKQCPIPRQVSSFGRIIEIPQLGGLHHRYERVPAQYDGGKGFGRSILEHWDLAPHDR
jgi:hypothetical protein